jgi:hypothetical protein
MLFHRRQFRETLVIIQFLCGGSTFQEAIQKVIVNIAAAPKGMLTALLLLRRGVYAELVALVHFGLPVMIYGGLRMSSVRVFVLFWRKFRGLTNKISRITTIRNIFKKLSRKQ